MKQHEILLVRLDLLRDLSKFKGRVPKGEIIRLIDKTQENLINTTFNE